MIVDWVQSRLKHGSYELAETLHPVFGEQILSAKIHIAWGMMNLNVTIKVRTNTNKNLPRYKAQIILLIPYQSGQMASIRQAVPIDLAG